MKHLPLLLILLSFSLVLVATTSHKKVRFQLRTNIIIVVDVEKPYDRDILKNVWILLDGISLRKYRIALYSTNGVSQKLINYQSRQCTVNKLRLKRLRHKRLSVVLKKAMVEVTHQFREDQNFFVVLTDLPVDDYSSRILKLLKFKSLNVETFVIQMKGEDRRRFSLTKTNERVVIEDLQGFSEIFKLLPFYKNTINACKATKGAVVYDECRRECECVNGRLMNCARIRRQFSTLPLKSRITYIDAYKTLASDPRFMNAFYNHIKIHPTVNFEVLHSKEQLLGFHRKYSLVFENFLRLVDCRLTIPYWNFALHAKHLFKRVPGYHMWDDVGGFGSTHTSEENGFCVQTGPFKYPQWKLPISFAVKINEKDRAESVCDESYDGNEKAWEHCNRILSATFTPRCMTRLLKGKYKVPSYAKTYKTLHSYKTTFKKFEHFLRITCHAAIHDNMGGDFGYGFSSILPEFFPLHSMLDAMWDYWQHKGPGKRYMGHWKNDKHFRLIGFHTPRYWYLDNNNLEMCGLRIKYTNIFPKKPEEKSNDWMLEDVLNEDEMMTRDDYNDDEEDFMSWYFTNNL